MKVVLGGVTKEVNGKKREVFMITNVTTRRQTIKMRFKPEEKAEKERLAAMNAQRQKTDIWERKKNLAELGQEGQPEPPPTPKGKDKKQ